MECGIFDKLIKFLSLTPWIGNVVASIVGAIIGASIAIIGNWLLTDRNARKKQELEQESARRLILFQLQYSIDHFEKDTNYENLSRPVYLNNWAEYIEKANFSPDDRILITHWIQHLLILGEEADRNISNAKEIIRFAAGATSKTLVKHRLDQQLFERIKEIINKFGETLKAENQSLAKNDG